MFGDVSDSRHILRRHELASDIALFDEMQVVLGQLEREFGRLRPVYESAQVSSTSPS